MSLRRSVAAAVGGGRVWPWLTLLLLGAMLVLNVQVLRPWTTREVSGVSQLCDQSSVVDVYGLAHMSNLSLEMFAGSNEWQLRTDRISVVGSQRPDKGFLTIGVPSIRRVNDHAYLLSTLASIVEQTSAAERATIVVVVFLADWDEAYKQSTAELIIATHRQLVESGFIQIIRVRRDFYPPLSDLKRNFNDAPARVSWRAKQVIDFALMFAHAHNLSHYYVQIEDDVVCAPEFVAGIRQYIELRNRADATAASANHPSSPAPWAMLEFSELGFIGKLFRSSDLARLARYLATFYVEQPVDWLMGYFRLSMGQRSVLLRKPTLFQHIGLKSSFDITKDNPLKDRYFAGGSDRKPIVGADNPSALVLSAMPHHKDHLPDLAYSAASSAFFWATNVTRDSTVLIVLEEPAILTRVYVKTGNDENKGDILTKGTLLIGPSAEGVDEGKQTAVCKGLVPVGRFREDGVLDVGGLEGVVGGATRCVAVRVDEAVKHWVIFYQVAIFVVKKG